MLTTAINTRQPTLNFVAENAHTDNNHILTNEVANTFHAWSTGTYTNVAGLHQVLTMGTLYEYLPSVGTTWPIYLSANFKARFCSP
jgi:hypothetical protein